MNDDKFDVRRCAHCQEPYSASKPHICALPEFPKLPTAARLLALEEAARFVEEIAKVKCQGPAHLEPLANGCRWPSGIPCHPCEARAIASKLRAAGEAREDG